MLPATTCSPARVVACRAEIAAQVAAYRDLVGAASKASGMSLTRIDAALASFEPAFFNNLLVALDARFPPRSGSAESACGAVRAEVRVLAACLLHHGGLLAADAALPYTPEKSVLKIDFGERIALNGDDFAALSAACLAEIEGGECP